MDGKVDAAFKVLSFHSHKPFLRDFVGDSLSFLPKPSKLQLLSALQVFLFPDLVSRADSADSEKLSSFVYCLLHVASPLPKGIAEAIQIFCFLGRNYNCYAKGITQNFVCGLII